MSINKDDALPRSRDEGTERGEMQQSDRDEGQELREMQQSYRNNAPSLKSNADESKLDKVSL